MGGAEACVYVRGAPSRDKEHRRSGFGRRDEEASLGHAQLEIRKGHERAHSQARWNLRIRNSSKIPVFVVAMRQRQSLRENEQSQERKGMG